MRLMPGVVRCRDVRCPERKQCERFIQRYDGGRHFEKTFRQGKYLVCTKMIKHFKGA